MRALGRDDPGSARGEAGAAIDDSMRRISNKRSAAPEAAPLLRGADGLAAHTRVGMLPFDHDRQLASVVTRTSDGTTTLVTKGAKTSLAVVNVQRGHTIVN